MAGGIVLNTIAAVFAGMAFVLQRYEARTVEQDGLKLMAVLFRRPIWLLGLVCSILAAVLTFVAFTMAPIPVVQPFAAAALVFMVLFARPILGEHPGRREYTGIGLIVVGLAVGLRAIPEQSTLAPIEFWRLLIVVLGLGAVVLVSLRASRRIEAEDRALVGRAALALGLASGISVGMTVSMFRIVGVWTAPDPGDWHPTADVVALAFVVLLVAGLGGYTLMQSGNKHFENARFAPPQQVSNLLTPIVVAHLAFGQPLPDSPALIAVQWMSLGVVVVGMWILASAIPDDVAATATDFEAAATSAPQVQPTQPSAHGEGPKG